MAHTKIEAAIKNLEVHGHHISAAQLREILEKHKEARHASADHSLCASSHCAVVVNG